MILADTSLWVDHFRRGNPEFEGLLQGGQVIVHPFVIGELACGSLTDRSIILRHLRILPQAPMARHDEVMGLVEEKRLWSKGIGWIDAHLLASALLANARIWSLDKCLIAAAEGLNAAR
jgi:hypothetical protein